MAVADLSINYDRESAVDFTSKKLQNCNGMKHLRGSFAKEKVFFMLLIFYSAFYEPWNQYIVQKSCKETTQFVFLLGAI